MLGELLSGSVADALDRQEKRPFSEVEAVALARPKALDVLAALAPSERVHIIAEVKRASPSRGDLASITDPAALAAAYEQGGASAISVLTEERRFKGSLRDLHAVRDRVAVPVLRKDFIGNAYQVAEARAAGADMVLLIVAALDQRTLQELYRLIDEWGMTALVEAHTEEEVRRAVDLGATLIGINARDLSTFELDRDLFGRVAEGIPSGVIKIAESAVLSPNDVAQYRSAGADAVLIGEALVTRDPVSTLSSFLEAGAFAAGSAVQATVGEG